MNEAWPEAAGERAWNERLTDDSAEARSLRELCHDLIGPAATIKILATAAGVEVGDSQSLQRRLQVILAEAALIGDICAHVLGRTRQAAPVRLDRLAAETAESVRVRCRTAIQLDAAPVIVRMHPPVFARIVGNLLVNACQAAGPGGRVRLVVAKDGDRARLTVEDTGPGFSGRRPSRGSLGLDIVWSLVLDSGGTVQMDSSDLGGLRVTALFPCPRCPQEGDPQDSGAWPDPVLVGASVHERDHAGGVE